MKNARTWMAFLVTLSAVCMAEGDAWFPFVISYGGADNASSVAYMLDVPAGKHGFGQKGKASVLIAASGSVRNTGAKIERASKTAVRLLDWGRAPVLAEGVPCEVTFPVSPARLTCYALAADGSRVKEIAPAAVGDGRARITLSPACQTLWYEVSIRP